MTKYILIAIVVLVVIAMMHKKKTEQTTDNKQSAGHSILDMMNLPANYMGNAGQFEPATVLMVVDEGSGEMEQADNYFQTNLIDL